MSTLLGFLQLAVGLAALYVSIYLALKKKYEKLSELHLNLKQYIKKSDKIEKAVSLLNTIYIIITLVVISLYFSPFKGFFQFFKDNDFNTLQGKIIYVASSSISFLIFTICTVKFIFFNDIEIIDSFHEYIFCTFTYIYNIIIMLKINQLYLSYYTKLYGESLTEIYPSVYHIQFFMDIILVVFMDQILVVLYTLSYSEYSIFIDFLNDKFTDEN